MRSGLPIIDVIMGVRILLETASVGRKRREPENLTDDIKTKAMSINIGAYSLYMWIHFLRRTMLNIDMNAVNLAILHFSVSWCSRLLTTTTSSWFVLLSISYTECCFLLRYPWFSFVLGRIIKYTISLQFIHMVVINIYDGYKKKNI